MVNPFATGNILACGRIFDYGIKVTIVVLTRKYISSIFPRSSEANASELLENIEEIKGNFYCMQAFTATLPI